LPDIAPEATADGSCKVAVPSVSFAANVCVVVLVTIFVGFPEVMIAVVYDIVVFVLEAAANCAAARFSAEKNVKKLNLFQVEVFGL
jgi:hypothetical protein